MTTAQITAIQWVTGKTICRCQVECDCMHMTSCRVLGTFVYNLPNMNMRAGQDGLSVVSLGDMNAPNFSNSKLLASASTGAVGRAKVSSTSTATLGIGMSSGAKAYKENWRVDKPVMLIHGLCSSNLRCIKSAEKPAVCDINSATRGPAQWWMAW
jgi:hypothetical protein